MRKIPWWQTEFASGEALAASTAIKQGKLSQGSIVSEFERKLARYLGVRHVIATTSGSDALLLALWASGIRPGDEVLVPNRTWIATAHSVLLLGASPVIVDTDATRPVISLADLESKISKKTKAIVPVHMNGRNAHIDKVVELGRRYGLTVIEDAAQALGSRDPSGVLLGTKSLAGCFSLAVSKVISSGQGGFIASNHDDFAGQLRLMRTHGVENVVEPANWSRPGFNFRFTDVLASIALEQFKKLDQRLTRLRQIYKKYSSELIQSDRCKLIPMDLERGEIGPYVEVLCRDREKLAEYLSCFEIETRKFYPNLNYASYLFAESANWNSEVYGSEGLYLPSGPSLSDDGIEYVVNKITRFYE